MTAVCNFLCVTEEEVSYHVDAASAVKACGIEDWERALPINAVNKLDMGDELSLTSHASIFRISGKDIDYGPQQHR